MSGHSIIDETHQFDQQDLARFEQDGYVIARQLVDRSLCEAMLDVTMDHLHRDIAPIEYEADLQYPGAPESKSVAGGGTARRLKQAHSRDFVFTQWIMQTSLQKRLRQLLGPHVVMPLAHHNCIMTKQPKFSSETGWHQDIRYWSYQKPELVSVWLALGPEYAENGGLKVIPGSHRQTFSRERLDDDLFLRSDLPENQTLMSQEVHLHLEPGDVLFFHCKTFHAAHRNLTDETKYSAVFTFRSADNLPLSGSRSASLPELLIPASE